MTPTSRSPRTPPSPRRPPEKTSPARATPRLADLADEDKQKVALIVTQFTEACRHRDELADVVKEQESQVHHLVRERWSFTQENTRLAKEVEQLRQKLSEVEEANSQQICESRDKVKKICNANKHLSEICTEQKQRLAKQHTKAEEMEARYQTMVSAMKCLEFKLENSKKSIRKLRYHLDHAREERCFPARTAESSTQTEPEPPRSEVRCCCCRAPAPPSCSSWSRPCALTSSGPLSRAPVGRQASEASTGPLTREAGTGGVLLTQLQPPPGVFQAPGVAAGTQPPSAGDSAGRPPLRTSSQLSCPISGAACRCPATSPGSGGVLDWASASPPVPADPAAPAAGCPCWHQLSPAGQLEVSPQAVEDWVLGRLFFSGRAPCSVAHAQLP